MTKAEAISKYRAVRKRNGKYAYLFFGALGLPFLVVTPAVWYIGASRETAAWVGAVFFVVTFSVTLSYFIVRTNKEFERAGLSCPFCGTPFDGRTIATCKCWKCGHVVLDSSAVPEQPRVLFSISLKTIFVIVVLLMIITLHFIKSK